MRRRHTGPPSLFATLRPLRTLDCKNSCVPFETDAVFLTTANQRSERRRSQLDGKIVFPQLTSDLGSGESSMNSHNRPVPRGEPLDGLCPRCVSVEAPVITLLTKWARYVRCVRCGFVFCLPPADGLREERV